MKIVHFSTRDSFGGASIATLNLHRALQNEGHTSTLLCWDKRLDDPSIVSIKGMRKSSSYTMEGGLDFFQQLYAKLFKSESFDGMFTSGSLGFDLSSHPHVLEADILVIHWIVDLLSIEDIAKLLKLGKPVVWVCHDMWAFTGGCHFSSGCLAFAKEDCKQCPMLKEDPFAITQRSFKDKTELWNKSNLTIVTPSRWLADVAKSSPITKECYIQPIANSINETIFFPEPKLEARKNLNLDPEATYFMFSAQRVSEKRKGLDIAFKSLALCMEHKDFQTDAINGKVRCLLVGEMDSSITSFPLPCDSLGYVSNPRDIRSAYSAADLYLLPTVEDNLPNTMLEAMSCSTPVLAFNIGGIPDAIKHGENGYLAQPPSIIKYAEGILDLYRNKEKLKNLGKKALDKAQNSYHLKHQAQNYLKLFEELTDSYLEKQHDSFSQSELCVPHKS